VRKIIANLLVLMFCPLLSLDAAPLVTNLGLAAGAQAFFHETWFVFTVGEESQGEDLNGDGDKEDDVWHTFDLATGKVTNLGLSGSSARFLSQDWFVLYVSEASQRMDLNADGDLSDWVAHAQNLKSGQTYNLGVAAYDTDQTVLYEKWLVVPVHEREQHEDINGDGDMFDVFPHLYDLETGFTQNLGEAYHILSSGEWLVLGQKPIHVRNLKTGQTTVLPSSWRLLESGGLNREWLLVTASEREEAIDLNGDGDTDDWAVLHTYNLETAESRNLKLTDGWCYCCAAATRCASFTGRWFVFPVAESGQGQDLNNDGDATDTIVHVYHVDSGRILNLGVDAEYDLPSLNPALENWLVCVQANGEWERNARFYDLENEEVWYLEPTLGEDIRLGPWLGAWIGVRVSEAGAGRDLNADGDLDDWVTHLYNLETHVTINIMLSAVILSETCVGGWVPMNVFESLQGEDLNSDGDTLDEVTFLLNPDTLETRNLRLSGTVRRGALSDNWLVLAVPEHSQNSDLNADGDTADYVLHVYDVDTEKTVNTTIAGGTREYPISEDWLAASVSEDGRTDLNNDGDKNDWVWNLIDLRSFFPFARFRRGDANASGRVDIADAISLLSYLFGPADDPSKAKVAECVDAADANDDGTTDIADAIKILGHLFAAEGPLPGPFGECGIDMTADDLGCSTFAPCH